MAKSKVQSTAVAVLSLLVAVNLFIIWSNSLLPADASSAKSGFLTSIIMRLLPSGVEFSAVEHIVRKCAHFCEFALLGALSLSLTYSVSAFELKKTWSYTAVPVLGCLFAASTDETIQIFVDRGNSVADVALDFSGSITAMALVYLVLLLISHRKKREAVHDEASPTAEKE